MQDKVTQISLNGVMCTRRPRIRGSHVVEGGDNKNIRSLEIHYEKLCEP